MSEKQVLDIKPGTPVMITQNTGRGVTREYRATVESVARVYLMVRADGEQSTFRPAWKIRRDTQQENVTGRTPGAGMYQARLWTMEQWAQRQTESEARAFLQKAGIRIERDSSWDAVTLAAVIKANMAGGEVQS